MQLQGLDNHCGSPKIIAGLSLMGEEVDDQIGEQYPYLMAVLGKIRAKKMWLVESDGNEYDFSWGSDLEMVSGLRAVPDVGGQKEFGSAAAAMNARLEELVKRGDGPPPEGPPKALNPADRENPPTVAVSQGEKGAAAPETKPGSTSTTRMLGGTKKGKEG